MPLNSRLDLGLDEDGPLWRLRRRWFPDWPEAATWEGWTKFHAECAKRHPFKHWLVSDVPTWFGRWGWRFRDAKWWVLHRVHPGHRYHVVQTGLEPGYYDVDTLMVEACGALLKRYVDDEMGGPKQLWDRIEWLRSPDAQDPHAPEFLRDHSVEIERLETALRVYRWYTIQRPIDEALEERTLIQATLPDDHVGYLRLEAENQRVEDQMLADLVRVRRWLWT